MEKIEALKKEREYILLQIHLYLYVIIKAVREMKKKYIEISIHLVLL